MKKIISFSTVGLSFLTLAQSSFATDFCPHGGGSGTSFAILCHLEVGQAIGAFISFIFILAVIVSLGFLIYGGLRWITSGGDKTNIETARGTILASIIGLVIIFLSYVILNLVLQFFFHTSLLQNFTLPTING